MGGGIPKLPKMCVFGLREGWRYQNDEFSEKFQTAVGPPPLWNLSENSFGIVTRPLKRFFGEKWRKKSYMCWRGGEPI